MEVKNLILKEAKFILELVKNFFFKKKCFTLKIVKIALETVKFNMKI